MIRITLSHGFATYGRPPEVSSTAFRASPPNLRSAPLMEMGFAEPGALARSRPARPHIRFLFIGSHPALRDSAADYDNDGDWEIVVTNIGDSPDRLRHNRTNKSHSILVKTVGVLSNRDGIGTEVVVVSGGLTQYDQV